jgi:MYXO-CTERM domain-containing protein
MATCQSWPPSATLTACLATCAGDPCGVARLVDGGIADSNGSRVDSAATHEAGPAADAVAAQGDSGTSDGPVDGAGQGGSPADATSGPGADGRRSDVVDANRGDRRDQADAGCGCAAAGTSEPVGVTVALLLTIVALGQRRKSARTSRLLKKEPRGSTPDLRCDLLWGCGESRILRSSF